MLRYLLFGFLLICASCDSAEEGGSPPNSPDPAPDPMPSANSAPVVASENADQAGQVGTSFDYDASQNGATFSDPDGDALTYSVELSTPSRGLSISGTNITGTPTLDGAITVSITASDPDGLTATDTFEISVSTPASQSPNILLIIADDYGQDASAQYALGSDLPDTPTLDQLAATGLVFENLWVSAVCSPTRAALITGKHARRTSVFEPGDALPSDEVTLHAHLRDVPESADYASALIGKWHLGTGASEPTRMGIDHFAGLLRGGVGDYFDWTLTINDTDRDVTSYATTEITDQAIDWLSQQSGPWFAWVAYNAPHSPFHLPPSTLHDRTLSGSATDIDNNPRPYYLAAIEAMDHEIGRLLDSLDPDVRNNTIILFIGDNGTPRAVLDPDAVLRGSKGNVFEGGVRVPMIVSGAGVTRVGEREDAIIQAPDFFATISELAGQELPMIHDARSFASLLRTSSSGPNDYIFSEYAGDRTVRDSRYKLIERADGEQEFYDLESDIDESNDLIGGAVPIQDELQDLEDALAAIIAGQ